MRILLLKGQSLYGGTRLFVDLAAAAFERAGHVAEVLDLTTSERPGMLVVDHARTARPDVVFSICIGADFEHEGRTISDLFGAPHVVWQTDYILSQAPRLHKTPRTTVLLMVDPSQVDALRATFGPERFDHLGFFPHPAVGEAAELAADAAAFEAERPIEVLWSGSFQKPEDASWTDVPAALHPLLRDAVDAALATEWTPPHLALATVLNAKGIDTADPDHRGVLELARYVDEMVRRSRRFEFIKAVAKTGVKLHIVGEGWASQLYRFKGATYEGPVDMTRMAELMRRSRVVLNTNGNFGAGSHERPFSAALAGAACFSDYSRYYETAFGAGEIELFRWKDLNGGMAALKALAGDPARCFEMGRAAQARALAEHTWDRRIDLILDAAEAVKAPTAA